MNLRLNLSHPITHALGPYLFSLLVFFLFFEQITYLRKRKWVPSPALVFPFPENAIPLIRQPTRFWDLQSTLAKSSGLGFSVNYIVGKFMTLTNLSFGCYSIAAQLPPKVASFIPSGPSSSESPVTSAEPSLNASTILLKSGGREDLESSAANSVLCLNPRVDLSYELDEVKERVVWESNIVLVPCGDLLKQMKAAESVIMKEVAELIVGCNEEIRIDSVFYPLVSKLRKNRAVVIKELKEDDSRGRSNTIPSQPKLRKPIIIGDKSAIDSGSLEFFLTPPIVVDCGKHPLLEDSGWGEHPKWAAIVERPLLESVDLQFQMGSTDSTLLCHLRGKGIGVATASSTTGTSRTRTRPNTNTNAVHFNCKLTNSKLEHQTAGSTPTIERTYAVLYAGKARVRVPTRRPELELLINSSSHIGRHRLDILFGAKLVVSLAITRELAENEQWPMPDHRLNLALQLQVNEQQARTSTAGSTQTQTRKNINVNARVQAGTSIAEEATTTKHTRTRTFANANIVRSEVLDVPSSLGQRASNQLVVSRGRTRAPLRLPTGLNE
ncbi:hypothetical protein CJ030_MR5G009639 [Morella rubra]|uniref:Uncharacterized protein n=1 Tax=Morella rubra TaxID=262757 RepID=A0A6A1VMY1_9ROSI|nr:hypothetical protein CJ030_MR5G009639 [Morella rubra]